MYFLQITIYAILAGLIPAIIWLNFWLQEDNSHPEPKKRILITFCIGALAALVAYPLEYPIQTYLPLLIPGSTLIIIILSVFIEEIVNFGAYFGALNTPDYDEPIDAIVYLTTAALGFSALENIIFILVPLLQGGVTDTILTINLRFIGASLLHIASSGIVGLFLGFAFYKPLREKIVWVTVGIILATSLHAFLTSL